jgi:uncharacterized protein (TIGR00251 family)
MMNEDRPGWYRWEGKTLLLSLRVQPRSRCDQFIGPHGDFYKVRITAPPVEGKANDHLLGFLAKAFGVNRSQVVLESGPGTRNKRFRIHAPSRFPLPVDLPDENSFQ